MDLLRLTQRNTAAVITLHEGSNKAALLICRFHGQGSACFYVCVCKCVCVNKSHVTKMSALSWTSN